jgi:hypothetical protein
MKFKSKLGIDGFNKETVFLIKEIPTYGNIKVYYKEGILERFFWMYKTELETRIANKDFIINNN